MTQNPRIKANKVLGKIGEKQACDFLSANNFQILETNFRYKRLEIDVIALDNSVDEIVFVEVKTRKSDKFGEPALAVNYKKLNNIALAGQIYLKQKRLNKQFRFDIISILPEKIEHFKNVTAE